MSENSPIRKRDFWFLGEDQDFFWDIIDNDGTGPANIAGWTMDWRLAVSKGTASVLTKAVTLIDTDNGRVRVEIDRSETLGMTPRTYYYELSRIDLGFNQVIAHGDAVLQERLT